MKRYSHLTFIMLLLLYLAGCDQTRPDVIEKLLFSNDDQWLERDTSEDAFEMVDGQSCNDYRPYPLPIDTTIYPVINPAGDLDYFNLQTTSDRAGWLSVWSEKENVSLRIFSSNLDEYEDFRLDEFFNPVRPGTSPEYWTALLFLKRSTLYPDTSLTVLVAGESSSARGDYTLRWQRIIEDTDLRFTRPRQGITEEWRRGNSVLIEWAAAIDEPVAAALMKGPVIIKLLSNGEEVSNKAYLDWAIPDDLEPGTDYRLMLFHVDNPRKMSISNAFEIY